MECPEPERIHAFLIRRIEAAGDAAAVAEATLSAWSAIDQALQPILGKGGVAGLYRRSLHQAAEAHPWLDADGTGTDVRSIDPNALHAALASQPTAEARAGAAGFLRAFDALLSSLVGPSLTARLLGPVWLDEPHAPNEQDTRS